MRMRAERKQRKAERKHGDTEGHCMTPGSRYARHPGVGHINRKTFCSAFPNHFVSILHLLTQNELWFFHSFSNNF